MHHGLDMTFILMWIHSSARYHATIEIEENKANGKQKRKRPHFHGSVGTTHGFIETQSGKVGDKGDNPVGPLIEHFTQH